MLNLSLVELSDRLARREFSCRELTQFFLSRIAEHNKTLNCFVHVDEAVALQKADEADRARAAGHTVSTAGIPYAHKDIFCTTDSPTTCASEILRDYISPYNATVTDKLNDAGMVMLGKTNMDEFAMGSSTETGIYGATRNPWNTDCVAGGSSGGSAAAVAAGLAPCATGTDTGGSIRQPAAFCGLTGIKPTYGRVSRHGIIAYASSLDQAGVFGRSAEDCALLLRIISGHDAKDATSLRRNVPDYIRELNGTLRGQRIGIIKEHAGDDTNDTTRTCVEQAIAFYKSAGCEIVEIDLPALQWAIPAYYVIAMAECSSNLSRYDGVHFGHRCKQPRDLTELYKRSRAEGFGSEVKRRILVGTHVLSAGYYDAYYLKAQRIRRHIAQDFKNALEQADFLICPVSPTVAFGLGEKTRSPVQMYLSDIYTVSVNLAGLPAISVPAGYDSGLPCGFQLIGQHFDEAGLLSMARAWQTDTDWHRRLPEAFQ